MNNSVTEPPCEPHHHKGIGLLLFALILLSAAVLWPGIYGPFLFDDNSNIPKSFIYELTLDELSAATWANTSGTLKRPVSALSFAITQWLTGEDPLGFKVHNILIHLGIGLLAFIVSRRLFRALSFSESQQNWAALVTTAFWLLHPLHISTVLYPVQRMAQLSTLFTLLAIYSYLRARQNHQYWLLINAFPAASLLAIFSKENGALIPLFIVFIELILFHFNNTRKSSLLPTFWIVALALPLMGATLYLATHPGFFNYSSRDFSLTDRIYTQLFVLIDYLKLIVFADINNMTLFHDDLTIVRKWNISTALAAIFHGSLWLSAIILRKKTPLISLAIIWFYAAHAMESTVFPLEMMFEHRNYLALLGIALAFGGAVSKLSHNKILIVIAILLLTLLAANSHERASTWSSAKKLYQTNAANHPQSARAHIAYANELLLARDFELAVKLLIKAAQLNPADAGSLLHVIKVSCFGPITFKDEFYQTLNAHYSNKALTPYGQQSLHQISKRYIDGKCERLDTDRYLAILDSIQRYQPWREGEMLMIKARITSRHDLEQSMQWYEQSFKLSKKPRLLSEQAAVLISHQKTQQALDVIEKLREQQPFPPTLTREFKALMAWYEREHAKAAR